MRCRYLQGELRVRGYDWAQFIHPDDRAGYVDAYRQALSKETFFEAEFRFRRHDGQYRWMRSVGRPRYNGRHEFLGYSGLTLDITEQKNAEMALRESERALAAEVAAMARMQEISTRLLQADDFSALLDDILAAAIDLSGADMGNVQLVQEGALKIAAQRGFEAPFLDFFNNVQGLAACGKALETRERVIVEDVARSPIFVGTPALQVMLAAQARAVQSTPLISRSGRLLGMLSTHYRTTQKPGEHQLRLLDVLSRQAADLTERAQSEIQLRCESSRLDTLNDMAKLLLQDLDLGRIVQTVTDNATELSGANRSVFLQRG